MKKNIVVLFALMTVLLATGCDPCSVFGHETIFYPVDIIKFKDGADLSGNVWVDVYEGTSGRYLELHNAEAHGEMVKLHHDYYMYYPEEWMRMAFMSFTWDDLENGNVPDGWERNWQEYGYDTIMCPYDEIHGVVGYRCKKNSGIPFYCDNCSTLHVDTIILNQMIDANPDSWYLEDEAQEYLISHIINW